MGKTKSSIFLIGEKGIVASIDQGIYSLANFIVNILLARTLSQDDYGIYAIAFAIYLIVYRPYSALILEPMSVLLPNRDERQMSAHQTRHLYLHFFLTIPLSFIIIFASMIIKVALGNIILFQAIFIMGIFIPFFLLFWLFRQQLYILGKPEIAMFGSLTYLMSTILFVSLLNLWTNISTSNVLVAIGFSNLIALIFILRWLKFSKLENRNLELSEQIRENWQFGKWIFLSAFFMALSYEGLILIFSGILGVGSAGVIKAAQNIVRPVQIVLISIFSITLPLLSRDYLEGKLDAYTRKKNGVKFFVICRTALERFLYNGNYSIYVDLFPLWGMVIIFSGLFNSYSIDIKAKGISKPIAYTAGLIAFVSIASGFVFIFQYDVFGVPLSSILGYVIGIFTLWIITKK